MNKVFRKHPLITLSTIHLCAILLAQTSCIHSTPKPDINIETEKPDEKPIIEERLTPLEMSGGVSYPEEREYYISPESSIKTIDEPIIEDTDDAPAATPNQIRKDISNEKI